MADETLENILSVSTTDETLEIISPEFQSMVDPINIYEVIKKSKYSDNQTDLYSENPIIGKHTVWDPLGTKVSRGEKLSPSNIPYDKFISIRLDGKNFSSVVPKLRSLCIFSSGYSLEFENIMKYLANFATKMFPDVLYVFTQSDEITIIIDTAPKNKDGEYMPNAAHEFSGRKDKLLSLASGIISTKFYEQIVLLIIKNNIGEPYQDIINIIESLPVITFDARIGMYSTLNDAFELVLWRAYDCSVNGLSQAIYNCTLPDSKQYTSRHRSDKINFLLENNLLPLTDHQAYGTLLQKQIIVCENINRKTGLVNVKNKTVYSLVQGSVINNIKNNQLPEIFRNTDL